MKNCMRLVIKASLLSSLLLTTHAAWSEGKLATQMINEYISQGASQPSAKKGKAFWNQDFIHSKSGKTRSCNVCHDSDLTKSGKHVKTDKLIDPMAPSVNPIRLTKRTEINKWFKRNCKWTLGRECTVQEKADVLQYLQDL